MRTLVTVLLTALLVFALATAWVDYVQPHLGQPAQSSTPKPSPRMSPVRKAIREIDPPPVSIEKPRQLQSAEPEHLDAAPQSAASLAQKLEEVKQQEASLVARQESLRMIYDDIRAELEAADLVRQRASADLAEAERRILKTAQRRVLSDPKPQSGNPAGPRTAGESPAIRAEALFIRHLADQGKMQTAISVLKSMKGRDAARVLTVLSSLDSKLAVQLADSVPAADAETIQR